jgi:hypothetical protein
MAEVRAHRPKYSTAHMGCVREEGGGVWQVLATDLVRRRVATSPAMGVGSSWGCLANNASSLSFSKRYRR